MGELISHAAIGGTILVLTGFTPEHLVAEAVHLLHLPPSLLDWKHGVDIRLGLVGLGVAVFVGDIMWRNARARRSQQELAGLALHDAAAAHDTLKELTFSAPHDSVKTGEVHAEYRGLVSRCKRGAAQE